MLSDNESGKSDLSKYYPSRSQLCIIMAQTLIQQTETREDNWQKLKAQIIRGSEVTWSKQYVKHNTHSNVSEWNYLDFKLQGESQGNPNGWGESIQVRREFI